MSVRRIIPMLLMLVMPLSGGVIGQSSVNSSVPSKKAKHVVDSGDFVPGKTVISEIVFTGLDHTVWSEPDAYRKYSTLENLILNLRQKGITINPNEKLDSRKIEKTIKITKTFLADLGYFEAKVVALGEMQGKGKVKLIFSVEKGPRAEISDIVFTGNRNFSAHELTDVLVSYLDDEWRLSEWERVKYCADRQIRRHMWRRGYVKAKIPRVARKYTANGFVVAINIDEGTVHRYGKIDIEGAAVFSREEVLDILGRKSGDILDANELQDFVYETLRDRYGDLGYLGFSAEFDLEFVPPASESLDSFADIKVIIDEGKQFKLAIVEFTGVSKTEEAELRGTFPIKVGEVYRQKKFEAWVAAFNELGKYRFLDADQDVEFRTSDRDGNVRVVIKVSPKPTEF